MGLLKTDEPESNGLDTDNDLLYKIAIRLWRMLGEGGNVNETGPTAVTGDFYAIDILTDTVFSLLTDTLASGDVIAGVTITAPRTIYGHFTAFTLTSGSVRAYKN